VVIRATALAAPAPASWKITETVRGTNSPSFGVVTAAGPGSAWAFESTRGAWLLRHRSLGRAGCQPPAARRRHHRCLSAVLAASGS
jgi:hypothetical protein